MKIDQQNTKHKITDLPKELLLKIYELMVKNRVLEERLIQVYRQGQSFFWVGGPGEEAFGVPLGLLVQKGCGLKYDWLHLHYRATPTLIAMGLSMKDCMRLAMNKTTDRQTGGKNFIAHFCLSKWNVTPVTSVVSSQYSIALGTAHVQSREKTSAITIVTGGEAGSAEGDFASCLLWASRPNHPLPMFITVQNNGWGISTSHHSQHRKQNILERGKAFGIDTVRVNGNDPVETYIVLKEKIEYIRKNRRPVLLEADVSRLYGHSSASGANFVKEEPCCITLFEERLKKAGLLTEKKISDIKNSFIEGAKKDQQEVLEETNPDPKSIWKDIYAEKEQADWRSF